MLIDTKGLEKPIFVIVVLLLAAAIAYAGYNYGHVNTVTTPTVVTAPTPVPTPADTSYLTNVVTVDAMTTAAGFAQVDIRQDTRIFDVTYSDYDRLNVGDRVQFHVVSTYNPYGSVVYKTDYVVIVSHSWDNYYHYYQYNNKYYRDDNHVTVEVTRDEATRRGYVSGRPAHWSG
jgi:hypothetical protein